MSGHTEPRGGVYRFLIDNSLLLILGAVTALIWANVSDVPAGDDGVKPRSSYQKFVDFNVAALWGGGDDHADHSGGDGHAAEDHAAEDHSGPSLASADHAASDHGSVDHGADGYAAGDEAHAGGGHHGLTLHFIINDILMALFFAIAAKEVWESLLPGGALSNPRKAATPLLATLGGILGPVVVYLAGAYLSGGEAFAAFKNGWAVPCATDIAFSYLVARIIFGPSHPAIAFLLLLAIADDAAGLVILAIFYPQQPIEVAWLLLTLASMAFAVILRKSKVQSHWAYLLGPGVICWFSFFFAHVHPALGLVPIIPFLPHAATDLGIFAREELKRDDTLNAFEHFWKTPVEYILGAFGLVNAGVVLSSVGTGTWLVLAGLLVGKPVGITLLTLLAEKGFKLEKPAGMDYRHVVTLGMVAGIGFTVALFVSVAAFREPGAIQDSVKMGALLSFAAAPLALIMGKMFGIRPTVVDGNKESGTSEVAAA